MDERLLSQREVAEMLGVSTKKLQLMRRNGELPCVRFGHRSVRYEPHVIAEFIRRNRTAQA